MGVSIKDKIHLQMTKAKAPTVSGVALIRLDITEARYIKGGSGWVETPHPDDFVEIHLIAADDSIVDSFDDHSVPQANQGWYLKNGFIDITAIIDGIDVDPSLVPGGLRLEIKLTKGDLNIADILRVNVNWGERI
jgi:hypothetical protein